MDMMVIRLGMDNGVKTVWTSWAESYKLKGQSIWNIHIKAVDSPLWKALLKIRVALMVFFPDIRSKFQGALPSIILNHLYKAFVPAKPPVVWFTHVWNGFSLPRVALLHWLVMWRRLATKDRMHRFGLTDSNMCGIYGLQPENHDRLFYVCPFFVHLMRVVHKVVGVRLKCNTLYWSL